MSHQPAELSQLNKSVRKRRKGEGRVFNSFVLLHSAKLCLLRDISFWIKLQTKSLASQTLSHTTPVSCLLLRISQKGTVSPEDTVFQDSTPGQSGTVWAKGRPSTQACSLIKGTSLHPFWNISTFPKLGWTFLATPLSAFLVKGIPQNILQDIPSTLHFLTWQALWHVYLKHESPTSESFMQLKHQWSELRYHQSAMHP